MKKLVIFYSFEGNTKLIAENIAQTINADTLELKPEKEIKSKGFMKYVWGGKAALMKKKPDLLPFDINFAEYDLIFIGTPVWACRHAPPLNTFFAKYSIQDKKIALFCCHEGGKGKIFEKMKSALKGNQFIGEADFYHPLKKATDANIQKAKEWAQNIVKTAS